MLLLIFYGARQKDIIFGGNEQARKSFVLKRNPLKSILHEEGNGNMFHSRAISKNM